MDHNWRDDAKPVRQVTLHDVGGMTVVVYGPADGSPVEVEVERWQS